MRFHATAVEGAFVVELEPRGDARGSFARAFCEETFAERGLPMRLVQMNLAVTHRAGTVRGLHYQRPPAAEAKLIRCLRGAVHDVAVDLRPDSPSYLRHVGVRLDARERKALYVPEGCAHGYQALEDDSEVLYGVSAPYAPEREAGVRFDDAAFGIDWPLPPRDVSEKDRAWPDYRAEARSDAVGRGR